MSCETCGHTMQSLCAGQSGDCWFWCPRCGTICMIAPNSPAQMEAPRLVERCRRYEAAQRANLLSLWKECGVHESIHPPEKRT